MMAATRPYKPVFEGKEHAGRRWVPTGPLNASFYWEVDADGYFQFWRNGRLVEHAGWTMTQFIESPQAYKEVVFRPLDYTVPEGL